MITSELFELFGKNIGSSEVNKFLEKYPSFKVGKSDGGSQYVVSEKEGIDLLFEPDDGVQSGKTRHLRNCQTIFLYSQGKDGHQQFTGEIPWGFNFSDSRKTLLSKSIPERTWKIGQGQVEIDFPTPSHDRWYIGDKTISAHYNYNEETGSTMYFIINRKKA
jgi:hypothetical protein